MKGKQKTLQEWQVYHVMTYQSQWKPIVDEEWEKYKSTWEAENPGKELDETRFSFMASFMRQKYLEETEDVQNNVKKRREELKAEYEGEGAEKNRAYQKYLDSIIAYRTITHPPVARSTVYLARLPFGESLSRDKQDGTYRSLLAVLRHVRMARLILICRLLSRWSCFVLLTIILVS